MVLELLHVLLEVFETLRQCESDGFITGVLKSKQLAKAKRKEQARALFQRLGELKRKVSTQVVAMALHNRASGIDMLALLGSSTHTKVLHMKRMRSASSTGDPVQAPSLLPSPTTEAAAAPAPEAALHGVAASVMLSVDQRMPDGVHLTRISAYDLPPDSLSEKATVSFMLTGQPDSIGRTTTCGDERTVMDLANPAWVDDLVSLKMDRSAHGGTGEEAVARPLELMVRLHGGADGKTIIGTAVIALTIFYNRQGTALRDALDPAVASASDALAGEEAEGGAAWASRTALSLLVHLALILPVTFGNVLLFFSVPPMAENYERHHTHTSLELSVALKCTFFQVCACRSRR